MASLARPKPPAQLVAMHADIQPQELRLGDMPVTIGRADGCTIVVARSLVSRAHARIERVGARYFLSDTQSVNGTFVHSRRIDASHMLVDNDLIGLGNPTALLRFLDPDPTELAIQRLHYDERAAVFTVDGKELSLSPRLLKLLRFLYRRAGQVCSHEACGREVWPSYDQGRDGENLSRAIFDLRERLERATGREGWIRNLHGTGYILECYESSEPSP